MTASTLTSEQKNLMLECLFRARAEIDTVNVILHGGIPGQSPAKFDGWEQCDVALLNASHELLSAQVLISRDEIEDAPKRGRTPITGRVTKGPTKASLALADEALKQYLTKE
jgi:hypothetical protein